MGTTISQYIETLENPTNRFQTLNGVFPKRNDDGSIRLRAHSGYVDFDIETSCGDAVLRTPLGYADALSEQRCLSASLKRLHSYNIIPFEFKESEMTVFDSRKRPLQTDIGIQMLPPHSSLDGFLGSEASSGSSTVLENALPRIFEFVSWAHRNNLGLSPTGVIMIRTEKGPSPRMISISNIDQSSQIIIATIATLISPRFYKEYGRQILLQPALLGKNAEMLAVSLAGTQYEDIATLAAGCGREAFDRALSRIVGYTHEDFCRLRKIFLKRQRPMHDIECPNGPHLGHAFSHYYWIDESDDDIICVMDGEGWKYVDSNNVMLFDRRFSYAMPFREGRAEVEIESGKGLIDKNGRFILPPEYEEVCWDEYNGIAIVMKYGKWSIRNREGGLVSREPFDYLGECSEGLIVAMRYGKWGFVDVHGRIAIALKYDDATSFSGGEAQVSENGCTSYIDIAGAEIKKY